MAIQPAIKQATLINQEGNKQVVDVGSQNAQNLFGQGYALMGATPKVPSQLSSDSLTNPSPNITPVVPEPTDVNSMMAGVKTSNEGVLAQLQARDAQLAEQTNLTELQKRQADYSEANKTALQDTQQQTWNQYGLDTNVAQVQKLMPQIAATTAAFDNYSVGLEGKTASASSIYGRQALAQRQKATEVAGLSAVAQAYQGNVDMARNIATDAINAQYKDQETYYNSLNDQISNAYTDLTAAEKKRADKLMIVNDERLRNIETEKETKKNISDIAVTLAQKGIDNSIINSVLKAPTYEEAIRSASASGGLKTVGNLTDLGNGNFRDTVTGNIGTINEIQQQQNLAQGIVTTSTGDAYDIKSYATDPTHEAKIQSILNGIGKFNTIQDIDNYIQSKYPNSPVTGEMIANAAGKYGVSWEMMTAIMAQDSSMGTAGKAVRTKNPGNVGNTDSGGTKQFNSWQEGVDAVAKNLAWRKTTTKSVDNTNINETAANNVKLIQSGQLKLENIKDEKERTATSNLLATTPSPEDTATDLVAKEKAQLALDLKSSKGLDGAVGIGYGIVRTALPWNLGAKADFIAGVEQLTSGLSLEELIAAKGRGATFGALSDSELRILSSAATRIGTWRIKDKNGNVTGYKASEKSFKDELDNINKILLRGVKVKNEINSSQDPLNLGVANSTNPLAL